MGSELSLLVHLVCFIARLDICFCILPVQQGSGYCILTLPSRRSFAANTTCHCAPLQNLAYHTDHTNIWTKIALVSKNEGALHPHSDETIGQGRYTCAAALTLF